LYVAHRGHAVNVPHCWSLRSRDVHTQTTGVPFHHDRPRAAAHRAVLDQRARGIPGQPWLGAGEPSLGPTAAAIANAIFDATDLLVRDLPLTPGPPAQRRAGRLIDVQRRRLSGSVH
jgi:hypothetical protein